MNKKEVLVVIGKVREISPKRNFNQTFDLILNLKSLNLKKSEEKVDDYLVLPYMAGKKIKVCAFVGHEISKQAEEVVDEVIVKEDLSKYVNNSKIIKKLGNSYDFFVAQANLMVDIAKVFGRVLGPLGKMPSPKSGCVITQNIDFKSLMVRLSKTVRLVTKNEAIVKVSVGKQDMADEEIAENIISVYNYLLGYLPKSINNIGSMYLKLTMGPIVNFGGSKEKGEIKEEKVGNVKKEND